MNQKKANEKGKIVSKVYTDWEDQLGQSWARWRMLPMWVIVAKRKTPCEYCTNPIMMGELRANTPTVHATCFMRNFATATELYTQIQNKIREQGIDE